MDNIDIECEPESDSEVTLFDKNQDNNHKNTWFTFVCELCGRNISIEMPDEWLPIEKLTESDITAIKEWCSCTYNDYNAIIL